MREKYFNKCKWFTLDGKCTHDQNANNQQKSWCGYEKNKNVYDQYTTCKQECIEFQPENRKD